MKILTIVAKKDATPHMGLILPINSGLLSRTGKEELHTLILGSERLFNIAWITLLILTRCSRKRTRAMKRRTTSMVLLAIVTESMQSMDGLRHSVSRLIDTRD